jgi:predicted negative regulator of RcsB-dependent stress response
VAAYSDQEEVEKLKAWWKDYGGALLIGVLIGLVLLFGNKYWQQYKEEQRIAASDLYSQMLQLMQESKNDDARVLGAKLVDEYARTPYAGLAALALARVEFETKHTDAARERLEWAIAHAIDPAVVSTARLRLGRLHLANGDYNAALALAQQVPAGFEADYLELKGDALTGLKRNEEARSAYTDAVKQAAPNTPARRLLEMKLEDAGGPTSPIGDGAPSAAGGSTPSAQAQ